MRPIQICHPESCLHDFLPPERDPSLSTRLRHPTVYPDPRVRTRRYCSFMNYAPKNYQWHDGAFSWYGVRGAVAFGSNPITNPDILQWQTMFRQNKLFELFVSCLFLLMY